MINILLGLTGIAVIVVELSIEIAALEIIGVGYLLIFLYKIIVSLHLMQKANKISAFFFLGLFSLIILHQAFPHLHHQHEDSRSHSHSDVAHSGEHHHHHDGSKEKEQSPFGFFGFLLDMHVHSTVSTDIVVLKRSTIEQQTVAYKDFANSVFDTQRLIWFDNGQNESPPGYHPPNTYFNPYLSHLDLRGPPAFG